MAGARERQPDDDPAHPCLQDVAGYVGNGERGGHDPEFTMQQPAADSDLEQRDRNECDGIGEIRAEDDGERWQSKQRRGTDRGPGVDAENRRRAEPRAQRECEGGALWTLGIAQQLSPAQSGIPETDVGCSRHRSRTYQWSQPKWPVLPIGPSMGRNPPFS